MHNPRRLKNQTLGVELLEANASSLVCFGPTENRDLKETYCPTAGTGHYTNAGAQLLCHSCRARVMGQPNPQGLPCIQMP